MKQMSNREADNMIGSWVTNLVTTGIFWWILVAVITSPITWWISGIVFVVWLFKR